MTVKLIKKKKLKISQLENKIFRVLLNQAKINEKRLQQPTKTFTRVEPKITSKLDKSEYSIVTAPLDDDDGKIYGYLDKGTEVRYAQLSADWESKTSVGSFNSGKGAGNVLFIDTNNPKPGIEARGWSDLVVDEELPKFTRNTQKALKSGLDKLY